MSAKIITDDYLKQLSLALQRTEINLTKMYGIEDNAENIYRIGLEIAALGLSYAVLGPGNKSKQKAMEDLSDLIDLKKLEVSTRIKKLN
jgi:hypothetical protein